MNTLTIGERIKALRQEQNYSVDEMAKRAGFLVLHITDMKALMQKTCLSKL